MDRLKLTETGNLTEAEQAQFMCVCKKGLLLSLREQELISEAALVQALLILEQNL